MASKQKVLKLKICKLLVFTLVGFIGIALLTIGIYSKHKSKTLSFDQEPTPQVEANTRKPLPVKIKIEKAEIDLPVESASIHEGVWQVSDSSANFLDKSARPNEGGNIVIYGHNKKLIFGNLIGKDLIGGYIKITTEDQKEHLYQIEEVKTVSPSEIEVVSKTDYEVLTVYTCTGFLDSKRLIIKALPVSDIN